jgi:hypothetical protein
LSTGTVETIGCSLAVVVLLLMCWPLVVEWIQVPVALQAKAHEVILLVVGIFLLSLTFSGFSNALSGMQRQGMVQAIWVVSYVVETGLIFLLVSQGRDIRGLAEAFLPADVDGAAPGLSPASCKEPGRPPALSQTWPLRPCCRRCTSLCGRSPPR